MISEAHAVLSNLFSRKHHMRELLGQSLSSPKGFIKRDPEAEKRERRRRVPQHTFINLELLEACQVLSAILLEVPNVALADYDNRIHDMLSLSFHKVGHARRRVVFPLARVGRGMGLFVQLVPERSAKVQPRVSGSSCHGGYCSKKARTQECAAPNRTGKRI